MNKILVHLPANRDYAGTLEIQNAAGKRVAGPFRCCGRADDDAATTNKNPQRDPLLPFGDIPFGEYQIVKILPSGAGTGYGAEEFGSAGIVLMRPRLGDAALADANGRFGFFIQGGARSSRGLLRPTLDGSLRLADGDQRKFVGALKKFGVEGFCLVVCTAKLGAKVAVAKVPPKTRRNTPASLLLASSVIASTVSGLVRQAWVRTMFNTAGSAIASGVAFVAAEEHAHAQPSDYHPTGDNSPTTDNSHPVSVEPPSDNTPVYLNNDHQVVEPNAASGNLPPASAAGLPSGSPIVTAPENPTPTPGETQPAPENQNPTETTPAPMENTAVPETRPVTTPEETPANSENTEPHLNSSLPGIYLNETAPATTTPNEANQPNNSTTPEGMTPAETTQPNNSPTPTETPSANPAPENPPPESLVQPAAPATEPAAQAVIDHDNQNPTVAPQPEPVAQPQSAPAAQMQTEPDLKDAVNSPPEQNAPAPNSSGQQTINLGGVPPEKAGLTPANTAPTVANPSALSQLSGLAAEGAMPGAQPGIDTAGHQPGVIDTSTIATPPSAPVERLVIPDNPQWNNDPNVKSLRKYQSQLKQDQQNLEAAKAEYEAATKLEPNADMSKMDAAQAKVNGTMGMINYETQQVKKKLAAAP